MFIIHFNKLIRNKVLWTIISTIVCASFVAMFTQTNESQDANQVNRIGKVGRLLGLEVVQIDGQEKRN